MPQQQALVESADAYAEQDGSSRRTALMGAALVASGLPWIGTAEAASMKKGVDPLLELSRQVYDILAEKITGNELGISVPEITRLVLHDAITYDPSTKTGGLDGSIRFADELKRPENAGLAPVVKKLEVLQKEIQERTGQKVSFADTEAYTGQMILAANFKDTLCAKPMSIPCSQAYGSFGNKAERLPLGRPDADGPNPEGQVPWVESSVDDFKKGLKRINGRLTTRSLCVLAPALFGDEEKGNAFLAQDKECAGVLSEYEKSKATVTRNGYELAFFEAYTLLVNRARMSKTPYGLEKGYA
jgi:L-ascorbate peroxidase